MLRFTHKTTLTNGEEDRRAHLAVSAIAVAEDTELVDVALL